jgi:hypothetical protein
VVEDAPADLLLQLAGLEADAAPTNTPDEFLAACGVAGLGRLLAEGDTTVLPTLRERASDPRWRVREAVAIALQRLGDDDPDALFELADTWARAGLYPARAAVAGVSEPRLLRDPERARRAFDVLDLATAAVEGSDERSTEGFRVLRLALGYGWSVVIAALPDEGKARFERWLSSENPDVRWILRENLRKARLEKLDPEWVERLRAALL